MTKPYTKEEIRHELEKASLMRSKPKNTPSSSKNTPIGMPKKRNANSTAFKR